MRIVSVVACVAFFAGTGSALAADCNKGLKWPYVRVAGDCLTDEEIRTGRVGAFNGPSTVDVSAIKPAEVPAQSAGVSAVIAPTGGTNGAAAASPGAGALIPKSIFGGAVERVNTDAGCTKGTLWPFTRDPGDCLTAAEKKAGKTGVYGGGPGVTPVNAAAQTSPSGPAPSTSTAACERSWFWPFVRESNDCPTAADKKDGQIAANGGAPVMTQVSATTPAPAPNSAPTPSTAAASCQKGWFWPFVRESNDCPTAADKK